MATSRKGTELVLLGTAGGPRVRADRAGISSAVVVGDALYLVDFGYGACRQIKLAGLDLAELRAGFVTHLHSDHASDLANLLLYGWYENLEGTARPVELYGPGSRGSVPPGAAELGEAAIVCPDEPAPGLAAMVRYLLRAHATDVNDRIRDNGRRHPDELLKAFDIELPAGVPFEADTAPAPAMEPFVVYRDDRVRVSAILVWHAPMAPSYAFRFDTEDGAVVVSGDTGVCDNIVTLATGADVLVHEVIDEKWVHGQYHGRDPVARAMIAHHTEAHTSIPDTGRIAHKAGVHTLVLTHFVPGAIDRPRWHEAANHFDGRLIIGEDLDRIPLSR
ncbi:MAG: MBL fold metallo-hydrolase [Pseudonocardiaceae bacterium]|nr:MBL fold metallo-hydrolase [Pseudonocardiaceae bacterium]